MYSCSGDGARRQVAHYERTTTRGTQSWETCGYAREPACRTGARSTTSLSRFCFFRPAPGVIQLRAYTPPVDLLVQAALQHHCEPGSAAPRLAATGYIVCERYKACGLDRLDDRSKAPYRQANKLPLQVERAILGIKKDFPS